MEFFRKLFALLRHLGEDAQWREMIQYVGGAPTLYVILFVIVFAETRLVVTPFLPGDSLLFAVGAIGARDIGISVPIATVILIIAAVLGDAVNYWAGYKIGPKVFTRENSRLLNKQHLLRAHEFYEKYGGKTIILARFVPIVRTFAPFVAGVGRMSYMRFFFYNVIGGTGWVILCIAAGYKFGGYEFVKKNFELVIVAIVVISVLPMIFEFLRARAAAKRGMSVIVEATAVGESPSKKLG